MLNFAANPDPLANMTPEQAKEAQELMIQAYAEYLEGLKKSDPKEYKRVMDDLISKTPGALESKMQEQGLNLPDGKLMKDGQVKDGVEAQSIEVIPDPGFVIKTKNTKTDSKVFINVCVSEHIKNFSNIYLRVSFEHMIKIFCKLSNPSSPTHPKFFFSEAGLLVKLTASVSNSCIHAFQGCLQISRKGQFCRFFAIQ